MNVLQTLLGMGIFVAVLMVLLMIVVPVLAFAFWIWMIVDCAQRRFRGKNDKVVWILIIIFTHIIGALIYFFVIKQKVKR